MLLRRALAFGRGEHDAERPPGLLVLGKRQDRGDGLALVERRQQLTIGRPRVSRHLRQAPDLESVDLAGGREEQHRVVVEVTNISETASSALVAIPARPLPPRFCARKVESGVRLM
jgi:hypothetical protein